MLRCTQKQKSFCEGNEYVVTWALGHLVELAEPHVYDNKYKEWRMEDLPMLPEKMKLRESIKAGGLGTPATRAEIIEKLIGNYYIERHGKSLIPTAKAIEVLELVPPELKSPALTAQWELRLSEMAKGKESRENFMADIRQNAVELVKQVKESTATYSPSNLTHNKCPVCGQPMMQIQAKKGKKLVSSDRRCGYEEAEKGADGSGFGKPSKKEKRMNKRLIRQFSDNTKSTISLGDLLKNALKEKEEG